MDSRDSAEMQYLDLNGVPVAATFAEAFPMTGTRLIVTAATPRWVEIAAREFCGFATSVIACSVEAGVERVLDPSETPDGRPGVSILAFAFSKKALEPAIAQRVGQCILTCPTTACYDGLPGTEKDKQISVGGQLRYFGDGFQISKQLAGRRFWRIPVMDGEFLCEDRFGTLKGVGGGNLIIAAKSAASALQATEAAVDAMRTVADVILPFPGGIVRSGSKVGSKYKTLKASTNHNYCPSLRGLVELEIPDSARAVYEIVIDGFSETAVAAAMKAGLHAVVRQPEVVLVSAGNYGGKLGPFHFHLKDLL
jgi:formylmethanofuran--tetrahydromethanopterin N-formyltransferase